MKKQINQLIKINNQNSILKIRDTQSPFLSLSLSLTKQASEAARSGLDRLERMMRGADPEDSAPDTEGSLEGSQYIQSDRRAARFGLSLF